MATNFYMYFVAALIPFLFGALYYGPLMGKPWMSVNGFTEADLKKGNPLVIFGVSYLLMFFFSLFLSSMVIHQTAIFGLMMPEIQEPGSDIQNYVKDFFQRFGDRHRSFGHGAAHGVFATIFFIFPIIGINALFERRGFKYIFIHVLYWLVTTCLVGGLLCATLEFPAL